MSQATQATVIAWNGGRNWWKFDERCGMRQSARPVVLWYRRLPFSALKVLNVHAGKQGLSNEM